MEIQKIPGTNCFNCMYVSKKDEIIDQNELNDQGGIDPKNDSDMKKAKAADLITLPGGTKADAAAKRFCVNKEIQMYVTTRMCCAYWDNSAVRRPWKKGK